MLIKRVIHRYNNVEKQDGVAENEECFYAI